MTEPPDYSDDVLRAWASAKSAPMAWVSKEPEVVARRLDHPELQRDAGLAFLMHAAVCSQCSSPSGAPCSFGHRLTYASSFWVTQVHDEIEKAEAREAAKNAKRPT